MPSIFNPWFHLLRKDNRLALRDSTRVRRCTHLPFSAAAAAASPGTGAMGPRADIVERKDGGTFESVLN